MEFWNQGILELWNVGIVEYCNIGIYGIIIGILGYWNMECCNSGIHVLDGI